MSCGLVLFATLNNELNTLFFIDLYVFCSYIFWGTINHEVHFVQKVLQVALYRNAGSLHLLFGIGGGRIDIIFLSHGVPYAPIVDDIANPDKVHIILCVNGIGYSFANDPVSY